MKQDIKQKTKSLEFRDLFLRLDKERQEYIGNLLEFFVRTRSAVEGKEGREEKECA